MNIIINGRTVKSVFINGRIIKAIYNNGRAVWKTIQNLIKSCFANGKWDDTAQWTDDLPWKD